MCDLWQHTTERDTPPGAIAGADPWRATPPRAIARAPSITSSSTTPAVSSIRAPCPTRTTMPSPPPGRLLARDRRIPPVAGRCPHEPLARLAAPRRQKPAPALEVAMGLETAHPEALERLNKRMTVDEFVAPPVAWQSLGVALRVFLLVSPPFVPAAEQDEWLLRSIDVALRLRRLGRFADSDANRKRRDRRARGAKDPFQPPTLADLERSFDTRAWQRAAATAPRLRRPLGSRALRRLHALPEARARSPATR